MWQDIRYAPWYIIFFLLPTKPWYALETMIYYLILSCMIRLEDCIIGKKRGIYLFLLIDLWIVVAFFLEIFCGYTSFSQASL